MTEPHGENPNPYQSPATETGVPPLAPQGAVELVMVKKFRDQIHALGAVWLLIGGLMIAVGVASFLGAFDGAADDRFMGPVLIGFGAFWLTIGVFALLKQMWAVYVGLALSYLSLIGNLLRLSICGAILLLLVIIQAHRVIGWAKELWSRGVPLTTTVEQLLSANRPRKDA